MKRTMVRWMLPAVAAIWFAMLFEQPGVAQEQTAPAANVVQVQECDLPDGVVDVGPRKIKWQPYSDAKFVAVDALKTDDATKKIAAAMLAADPAIKGFRVDLKERLLCAALPNVGLKSAVAEYASDCSTNTQSSLTSVAEIRKSAEAALVTMTRLRHPKIPESWQAVVTEVAKYEHTIKLDVTLKEAANTPAVNSVSLR